MKNWSQKTMTKGAGLIISMEMTCANKTKH